MVITLIDAQASKPCLSIRYLSSTLLQRNHEFGGINMSLRGNDWISFQCKVWQHIEEYTIPQYGDKDEDQASEFTFQDCIANIKRYTNRAGRNSRGREEELRDLIKIAHYAQLAYNKLEEELKNDSN